MKHNIRCSCGSLKGEVTGAESAKHCVCYCKDCQAFAQFLNKQDGVLDASGGTDIVQINPSKVRFVSGEENLACMRLSEKGLLRWYASCCDTPIGNTPPSIKLPFVGLVHNCLDSDPASYKESFGEVGAHVNTSSANKEVKAKGMPIYLFKLIGMMLKARFDGSYKSTPFFSSETGEPAAVARVLTIAERESLG